MRKPDVVLRGSFLALLVLALGACASPPRPVTDSVTPIPKEGFSILAPSGPHWYISDEAPSGLLFLKFDPRHHRNRSDSAHTLGLMAGLIPAGSLDVRLPEGLLAAVQSRLLAEDPSRFKVVEQKLEPYSEQGTDCVWLALTFEETNNPHLPGTVLLMTVFGKVCRHPYQADSLVMAAYSERRPLGRESMLDAALREECEHAVGSLRFVPLK